MKTILFFIFVTSIMSTSASFEAEEEPQCGFGSCPVGVPGRLEAYLHFPRPLFVFSIQLEVNNNLNQSLLLNLQDSVSERIKWNPKLRVYFWIVGVGRWPAL